MWARIAARMDRPFARVRISTKITAVYAVILFVVLFATMSALIFGIYYSFYHQAEVAMEITEQQVTTKLDRGEWFSKGFWQDTPVVPGTVLRVTDITGRNIVDTDARYPSLEEVEAGKLVRKPFWADPDMDVSVVGNTVLYHTTRDVLHGGSIYRLHFLRTITAEQQFLFDLQRFLLFLILTGFLIALAAGAFVSQRVIGPVRDMIATAKTIEASDMSRRIDVPPTRDELHELAVTFNHMLDRLQAGFSQQQRFVSDASHELRTPVTVMLGYSDLLARWGQRDEQVLHEGIDAIRSEAENMQQLIEKLLFLARADQKRQVLHKENIKLNELVDDVMKKMKLVTTEHTVELLQNDAATIYADPVLIRQLLRIFLENSKKYTPPGGRITAASVREGDRIILTLADTGIGIAPEDLPRVFEKGYTGCNGRTDKRATGIGLYLCRRILEKLGHTIAITSTPGEGTTVRIGLQQDALEVE
ncbi:HAMP domain-containing sensor histidine kinase [Selenomonas sp.]|uniref:sensor histidine kinase n=1 Tax=Selenomonas sp. TaxID=2053611 RepID=UPI002A75656F|nr:HAMP domain-containing sensor histidine kinase [Selenomonas sp.]MDY3298400.1 HAMP domain-containing sensor histidine kinase [Selenomonas sp.]